MHLADLLFWLLIEFAVIFLFFLIPGYLIPCWHAYRKYFINSDDEKESRRIQERRPTKKGIRREIRLSLQTILVFSVMGTGLYQMYKADLTGIYWNTFKYPLYYIPVSFVLCLVVHDTMFYWTHRLMHWRPIFKYTHAGHHKSVSPTPWAIFAFQPAEAVLQFLCLGLIIVFIPMKPIVLAAYLSFDSMINIAGHTGHEVVPSWMSKHWFFKRFNNVTHHDNHHTNMRCNFGAFFNVWDRWMGTFVDHEPAEDSLVVAEQPGAPSDLVLLKSSQDRGSVSKEEAAVASGSSTSELLARDAALEESLPR